MLTVNPIGAGHSHYTPTSAGEKNHSCGWCAISGKKKKVVPSSVMAAHSLYRVSFVAGLFQTVMLEV